MGEGRMFDIPDIRDLVVLSQLGNQFKGMSILSFLNNK
jgi:hypothetical protein